MADILPHWDADCAKCGQQIADEMLAEGKMKWFEALVQPMWLCPMCGNKRCPKATWHGYKCTGSNEPGQVAEAEND